ncbi:MAG: methyl-accepting chemotaxis protein [Candidatus Zixiibacteriota bacterium]
MKGISVNTKVVASLGISLLVIFAVIAAVNSYKQSKSLSKLYYDNSVALSWALEGQISEIMVNGQNEKLQPLTEEIVSKGVLQELCIIDDQKIVKRSSDKNSVGKPTEDPVWSAVYSSGKDTTMTAELAGSPVLIGYKVFHNSDACSQCHDTKEQPIVGGLRTVVSQKPMQAAISSGVTANIILSLAGAIVLIGGIVLILRRQVFSPLADVTAKLEMAGQGNIDQNIKARSDDEIGRLLKAIQGLVEYIQVFSSASAKVAEGDLRVEVSPRSNHDRLGMAFSQMLDNLRQIIRKIDRCASDLVSATTSIGKNSVDIASGAQAQADQVRQVSAAVEQMAASAVETSNNTSSAAKIAEKASSVAGEGAGSVEQTIDGMQRIQSQVTESSQAIRELANSTERISDIVAMIDEISDQTNLLALNAAIEAARAGEQGRGFAVVADEVRKLADKTGQATRQIVEMIAQIRTQSSGAVSAMGLMVNQVDDGKNLVFRAGESLSQLVTMVNQVSHNIQQIAAAAQQQSVAAEEISRNVDQISVSTEGTVTHVQGSKQTCGRLGAQAEELNALVQQFRLTREEKS